MPYPPSTGDDPADRLFAQLKPVELEELTEAAHQRRRADDLARAFATPRDSFSPDEKRILMTRRPVLLLTAAAALGLAAAAAVAVPGLVGRDVPAVGHQVTAGSRTADRGPVDARTFLLAAAETVAREPAGSGRYWYTRQRVFERVQVAESEYMARLKALDKEYEAKKSEFKDRPAELRAADAEFQKRVGELKTSQVPYKAVAAYTVDSWQSVAQSGGNRSVTNQDVKITFATPEDEAKWKAAGSPVLREDKPRTSDGGESRIVSIDNPTLTMAEVGKLPTEKDALERRLRELYAKSPARSGANGRSFAEYMPQTALDLLVSPTTPGTRSALFKVLAEQPGITAQGRATDGLGRTGVALTSRFDSPEGEFEFRLTFAEDTAGLLEYEVTKAGEETPVTRVAFDRMALVNGLGDQPTS
ncbi:hypothetical protein HTZ77_37465 [Nonomuraea sp. SMC257]|uniref:CU044_5270 family protein n=1 Tax=Nonomuraea montanisoli TaxID=2741721 RepID=A0A7Y6M748_9ACTN|nr:hypothetical protein [Nonomuraea montanisoli]NUW37052.1 hypothetical protein [Nonomuraea montanisoli]